MSFIIYYLYPTKQISGDVRYTIIIIVYRYTFLWEIKARDTIGWAVMWYVNIYSALHSCRYCCHWIVTELTTIM